MTIRLANMNDRAVVILGDRVADIEQASGGQFSKVPMEVLRHWDSFADWASGLAAGAATAALDEKRLGPPVPRPANVFAIGVNYRAHAEEAKLEPPSTPMVFAKFVNCIAGPHADVQLTSAFVDWEVELVVVIGRRARHLSAERAFECIAGYTVGQDISDRMLQFSDRPPQFCLGKSLDGYGPIGPAIVSLDAFKDPNDLGLTCDIAGERMQDARTSDMIFAVPDLIAYLSQYCTLGPGDVIFTGTPAGVGSTREPRRYLQPGEEIVTTIENIGTLRNRCVKAEG